MMIKVKVDDPLTEKLNRFDKHKPYYPDEALSVIDIINNPRPEDKEFLKALEYYNNRIKRRINK